MFTKTALSPVGSYLRQLAPDDFLAAQLVPLEIREDIYALSAFRHELVSIRHKVKEPMMGLIRLQWWRETLLAVAEGKPAPAHEIMQPLTETLVRRKIPIHTPLQLIDAMERDFRDEPWQDVEDMANYARAARQPLLEMQFLVAGMEAPVELPRVAAYVGLLELLRQGRSAPLLSDEVISEVRRQREGCQGALFGRARKRMLSSLILADMAFRQMEKCHFELDNPRVFLPHPLRAAALVWAAIIS